MTDRIIPGLRRGTVTAPRSKSQEQRLLLADFLAGKTDGLVFAAEDADDILAMKRCLAALASPEIEPVLDCGESGAARRFLAPVAAALGKRPRWRMAGRLGVRPFLDYPTLAAGTFDLPGDISSQFVTGLLFALPLIDGDSEIRFTSPLQSRGYVELTLKVLRDAGIVIESAADGFKVRGAQRYSAPTTAVEGDWSGAAFWLAMNVLGSAVRVEGLDAGSLQPDRAVVGLLKDWPAAIDVSAHPDLFPALAVVAAARPETTRFTGIGRLRLKESDRVAAMADVLTRFGADVSERSDEFTVHGVCGRFRGGDFTAFGDHRIAMAIAVGATVADDVITIDDTGCVAKSYPGFFKDFHRCA